MAEDESTAWKQMGAPHDLSSESCLHKEGAQAREEAVVAQCACIEVD